jgi:hypothetical protein
VHVLFAERLVRVGRLAEHLRPGDVERIEVLSRDSCPKGSPSAAASTPGPSASWRVGWPPRRTGVYGRIGTCTQAFGTLASWLVDVLNVLLGALDAEAGRMFTRAAAGSEHARGATGAAGG